jgi:hypothetical protein
LDTRTDGRSQSRKDGRLRRRHWARSAAFSNGPDPFPKVDDLVAPVGALADPPATRHQQLRSELETKPSETTLVHHPLWLGPGVQRAQQTNANLVPFSGAKMTFASSALPS